MTQALRLSFPADPARLSCVRRSVRDFLGQVSASERTVEDVVLSLHEACKNAIRFGGAPVDIELELRVTPSRLCATVHDHGAGFDADFRCPGPANPRGRGLFLMSALMDDVQIDCTDGTTVTMSKSLTASAA